MKQSGAKAPGKGKEMSNYKAKKVATYRDRYFTVITYSYRGKEYDVTYPNDWSVLTSVARVQHEDAQAKIDKELDNPVQGEPIDLDEIWEMMGW